ncbi:helix-turn-helix domain-containing protein, partial [Chitinophaga pinensis]|uniref:helix-turn-helix domain-containing protein n=1 Tax=Chitinophaga pinensis TaxID=79329 RepID=UPI0021BD20B9
QFLAEQLHLSPSYLSDMLRSLMGQNAQQYIHEKLVEKSKELLSTTNLLFRNCVSLGFEHSQSFSKFFKMKAKVRLCNSGNHLADIAANAGFRVTGSGLFVRT